MLHEQAGQIEEVNVEDLAKATLGNLHAAAAMSENGGGDSDQPSRSHALTDALETEAGSGRTGPTIKVCSIPDTNLMQQDNTRSLCGC